MFRPASRIVSITDLRFERVTPPGQAPAAYSADFIHHDDRLWLARIYKDSNIAGDDSWVVSLTSSGCQRMGFGAVTLADAKEMVLRFATMPEEDYSVIVCGADVVNRGDVTDIAVAVIYPLSQVRASTSPWNARTENDTNLTTRLIRINSDNSITVLPTRSEILRLLNRLTRGASAFVIDDFLDSERALQQFSTNIGNSSVRTALEAAAAEYVGQMVDERSRRRVIL